jgi:hypothetical protein
MIEDVELLLLVLIQLSAMDLFHMQASELWICHTSIPSWQDELMEDLSVQDFLRSFGSFNNADLRNSSDTMLALQAQLWHSRHGHGNSPTQLQNRSQEFPATPTKTH